MTSGLEATRAHVFNYSTGPVELTMRTLEAMTDAASSSHMPSGQEEVAETLGLLRQVLRTPDDALIVLVPGSIRQCLDDVIQALVAPHTQVSVPAAGYWSSFLADRAMEHGASVDRRTDAFPADAGALFAVHVETEFAEIMPIETLLKEAREAGAVTLVDAACSLPDELPLELADVIVLGSHKCLGGPPGLAVLVITANIVRRRFLGFGSSPAPWALRAYAEDALWKRKYLLGRVASPAPSPPLVTYPSNVVCGLREALRERIESGLIYGDCRKAAKRIRDVLSGLGWTTQFGYGRASGALVRADAPEHLSSDQIRGDLLSKGVFVIGNVGTSSGGSIRIGTMSLPQIEERNLDHLLEALVNATARAAGSRVGVSRSQ